MAATDVLPPNACTLDHGAFWRPPFAEFQLKVLFPAEWLADAGVSGVEDWRGTVFQNHLAIEAAKPWQYDHHDEPMGYNAAFGRRFGLQRQHLDASGLRAKHVSEYEKPGAQVMDFVFTVCDRAAAEECAPWPGQPMMAYWGVPDPVNTIGGEVEKALGLPAAK